MAEQQGNTLRVAAGEQATVQEKSTGNSGASWVNQFPGSSSVSDLSAGFKPKVEAFLAALTAAGGSYTPNATLRPPERAFLMHWSWKIVKQNADAKTAPKMTGVDIDWWWGTQEKSQQKAQEMVNGYGINALNVAPALASRHTTGDAIDMNISWSGDLKIKKQDGTEVTITSAPKDHTNTDLHTVSATYGVVHFSPVSSDRVHFSTDGR